MLTASDTASVKKERKKLDGLVCSISSLSYRVEVLMGNILLLYVVFDPEYIYKCTPCPYIGRLCLLYYMTILNCKFKICI